MILTRTLTITSSSPPKAASAPKPDLHTPSKSAVAAMSEGRAMGLRKSGEELSYPTPTLLLPYSYPRFSPLPNFKLTSSRSPWNSSPWNSSLQHVSTLSLLLFPLAPPPNPSLHKACMQARRG